MVFRVYQHNAHKREGSKGAISVRTKDKCWNLFFRVDTNNGYSIFGQKGFVGKV